MENYRFSSMNFKGMMMYQFLENLEKVILGKLDFSEGALKIL